MESDMADTRETARRVISSKWDIVVVRRDGLVYAAGHDERRAGVRWCGPSDWQVVGHEQHCGATHQISGMLCMCAGHRVTWAQTSLAGRA